MRIIRISRGILSKGGLILSTSNKEEILDEVEVFIDEGSEGDCFLLTIEEMSEENFNNLPEFNGW